MLLISLWPLSLWSGFSPVTVLSHPTWHWICLRADTILILHVVSGPGKYFFSDNQIFTLNMCNGHIGLHYPLINYSPSLLENDSHSLYYTSFGHIIKTNKSASALVGLKIHMSLSRIQ